MGLSFPFTGSLFPLAFVGLVPILLVNHQISQLPKHRFWWRLAANFPAFLIYNLITSWWISNASVEGMLMAVVITTINMTIPVLFAGFISRHLGEGKGLLAFIVLWLSMEYGQFFGETAWPWVNFGNIFATIPQLIQWYEYSGILGGTLWILYINIFLYIVIRNVWFNKETFKIQTPNLVMLSAGLLIPVISSLVRYYSYVEKSDPVEVVVVQPNFESYTEKFIIPGALQLNKAKEIAGPEISAVTDLVLLPETAIVGDVDEATVETHPAFASLLEFSLSHFNVPILTGASTQVKFDKPRSPASEKCGDKFCEDYNTAMLVQPFVSVQFYHKSKLVPGAETIPFLTWFPSLKEYSMELGGTSGILGPGSPPVSLEASGLKFATLICYESVYGELVANFTLSGADILCVMTNDGWWGDTPGYKQHCAFSGLRAIENRRSVARSANTGISCLINQRGEVIEQLAWDKRGVLRGTLNRNTELTFYVRYGDLLGRVSLFLSIAMILYAAVTAVRNRGEKAKTV